MAFNPRRRSSWSDYRPERESKRKGPATTLPKHVTGKSLRRALKAQTWRVASILAIAPRDVWGEERCDLDARVRIADMRRRDTKRAFAQIKRLDRLRARWLNYRTRRRTPR